MTESYILAIDQGTSGTKTVIFDSNGQIISKATVELKSYFPQAGFVEQDPIEIYESVLDSIRLCLGKFSEDSSRSLESITTCGISNQRETFLLWDREGSALCKAIVWQCKRSVEICDRLKGSDLEDEVKQRTGLIIDPYFSGTKLIWLCENDRWISDAVESGGAYFGTIDSWLLFKLTGGRRYLTDYTNACRTLLFNINDLQWDDCLLDSFRLKNLNLPEPKPSSFLYGESDFEGLFPNEVTISAMIGDSHASAFGEGCFCSGMAKATMGTGSSILLNTGPTRIESEKGMVTTICWSTSGRVDYALEGIIVTCGATINWLRDRLGLFADSRETEKMALSVENSPYQIKDVIMAMEQDSGIKLTELRVDGGITGNHFVMQLLADLLETNVVNIGIEEVSALGAAYLAGLGQGIFDDIDQLKSLNVGKKQFSPNPDTEQVDTSYEGWKQAVRKLL